MAGYYVPLPGAEIKNALIDYAPINNGLETLRDQRNQNRNALMQQQQIDMRKEEQTYQRGRDAKQDARQQVEWFGKVAGAVDREQDPARRAAIWQNALKRHPDAASLSPDYLDPIKGPKMVMAEAGQWRDPRDDQAKDLELQKSRAQIGLIGAQTAAANQRDGAKLMEVNGRIVRVAPNGQASEVYNAGPSDAKLPQGYRWGPPGPDGQPTHVPISGGPADKLTETESKDALFAERMLRSERDLQGVAPIDETGKFTKYNPAQAANVLWPDKGVLANLGNSTEWQQYQRAAREGLSAILRKDTGAAVTDEEFNTYFPTYFPIPGDSQEVIKQKQVARQTVAQGMRGASHRAFERMYPGYDQLNAPKTQPPAPPAAGDASGWGYVGVVK